ncbi:MAG: hypothetical protein WC291_08060 [Thermodesulfovibrionales bacterium]|jgi:hypothetical protein
MTAYRILFRKRGELKFRTGTFYSDETNAIAACQEGNLRQEYEYAYVEEAWP